MLGWSRGAFATSRAQYLDRPDDSPTTPARIYLEVWPGSMQNPVLAMVDTGASWCVFDPQISDYIQRSFEPVSDMVSLSTRIGTFSGCLYRVSLIFTTIESEQIDIEATVFVSPHWPGGNFLAYEGLLQRIRFAVDPGENLFYFGPL